MTVLHELASYIRSKNAGPFWVTLDLFFDELENFKRVCAAPQLSERTMAELFGTDAALVKIFKIEALQVIKISYPRPVPQGDKYERDMHSGQQYVQLLDLPVE